MTGLLTAFTLIVVAAVVLVLVGYLLAIIVALWGAARHLSQLAGGLVAIRDNTAPLPDDIPVINSALITLLERLGNANNNLGAIVGVASGETRDPQS